VILYSIDHVNAVRLHLWTPATSGPAVHPPGILYEHGEPWWNDIDRRKCLMHPPELYGSPTSSHLVANREELGEWNDEFSLWSIFVNTSKWFSTCRKILWHSADGFTFPLKEGVWRIFNALKNLLPQLGLNSWSLGPIVSMLRQLVHILHISAKHHTKM
jgi:hypothetical protein